MNDWGPVWDEWFNSQYALTEQINRAVNGMSVGKDDAFKAALYAAVIEDAAERLRAYLHPGGVETS